METSKKHSALVCPHCGAGPVQDPVTAVIVVQWRKDLLERIDVYSLHKSCAKMLSELEAKRLTLKYQSLVERQSAELEIKWGVQ
jgi:hypothetical protein